MVKGEAFGYMVHRYDERESPSMHSETNARGYALVMINGLTNTRITKFRFINPLSRKSQNGEHSILLKLFYDPELSPFQRNLYAGPASHGAGLEPRPIHSIPQRVGFSFVRPTPGTAPSSNRRLKQHASAKRRLTLPDQPASSDRAINMRRRYANLFNGYLGI